MPKLDTISQFLHRLSQYVILALVGVMSFWMKDIYGDFKKVKDDVADIKTKTALHELKIQQVEASVLQIKMHQYE